jgi:hypothetical protein
MRIRTWALSHGFSTFNIHIPLSASLCKLHFLFVKAQSFSCWNDNDQDEDNQHRNHHGEQRYQQIQNLYTKPPLEAFPPAAPVPVQSLSRGTAQGSSQDSAITRQPTPVPSEDEDSMDVFQKAGVRRFKKKGGAGGRVATGDTG